MRQSTQGTETTPRLVYMGTPEFACRPLALLAQRTDVEVALVVTQPDRPTGRGRRIQASPVAMISEQLGLPVYRTGSLRTDESRRPIVDVDPQLIVVAAFGLILGNSILRLPSRGCVNLHASLLPAYRGANPIAAAIRDGSRTTGVSLMRMERGLDSGAVYSADEVDINDDDTTESLTSRLSIRAGELLDRHLSDLLAGTLSATPQPPGATCTRPMTKDDGWIDWQLPAVALEHHVRAMWSWPRGWTTLPSGERLQVHQSSVIDGATGEPGTVTGCDQRCLIACGESALALDVVQLPGGRPTPGSSLLSRQVVKRGDVLGIMPPPPSIPLVVAC